MSVPQVLLKYVKPEMKRTHNRYHYPSSVLFWASFSGHKETPKEGYAHLEGMKQLFIG